MTDPGAFLDRLQMVVYLSIRLPITWMQLMIMVLTVQTALMCILSMVHDIKMKPSNEQYRLHSEEKTLWQLFSWCVILLSIFAESTDELWIGFNDRKTEGLFDWSDHSTVSFTSWEFGNPAASSDINDCVLIRGEVRITFVIIHVTGTDCTCVKWHC